MRTRDPLNRNYNYQPGRLKLKLKRGKLRDSKSLVAYNEPSQEDPNK